MAPGSLKRYWAVGTSSADGLIDVRKPAGAELAKAKSLLGAAAYYAVVIVHDKIFLSGDGEIWMAFDAKGECIRGVLKDVLLFGDMKGERL